MKTVMQISEIEGFQKRTKSQIGTLIQVGCFLGALSMLAGCGTMGATSLQSLDVKPLKALQSSVEIGSVALAENATRVDAVGVFSWGEFSQEDLRTMRQSLQNSLTLMQKGSTAAPGKKLSVHTLLRRYLVTASNNSGAALANIAWCAVDEGGRIVFHEQFYASHSFNFVGTLGGVKDKVNEAILLRITGVSAHLASRNGLASAPPSMPLNAFVEFDQATEKLPRSFRSTHIASGGGYTYISQVGKLANWNWASTPERINWESRLGGVTTSKGQ